MISFLLLLANTFNSAPDAHLILARNLTVITWAWDAKEDDGWDYRYVWVNMRNGKAVKIDRETGRVQHCLAIEVSPGTTITEEGPECVVEGVVS